MNTVISRAKVAIFDLGETLVALPREFDEEAAIARLYGMSDEYLDFLSQQLCFSHPGLSTDKFIHLLTDHLQRKTGIKIPDDVRQLVDLSIRKSVLQPDARNALSLLRERGIALCLISNTNPVSWDRIRHHRIEQMFDHIIFSCDVALSKPDPRIFELAFKHFAFPPEEFCVIGDKIRTIVLGVAHLGTKTVLVERRSKQTVVSTKLSVNAVVPDLQSLCDLVWLRGPTHA